MCLDQPGCLRGEAGVQRHLCMHTHMDMQIGAHVCGHAHMLCTFRRIHMSACTRARSALEPWASRE